MSRFLTVTLIALMSIGLTACAGTSAPLPDTEPTATPAATSTLAPAATEVAPIEPTFEPSATPVATSTALPTIAPEATATTPVRGTPVPAPPTPTATAPVRGTPIPLPTEGPVDDSLGLAVRLTDDLLKNSTYLPTSAYGNPVELVDGVFEDRSDPNATLFVRVLEEQIAYGDVDGDGIEDAVVPLATNTGGSGVFIDIALVSGKSGTAKQIAAAYLGDRVIVNQITAQFELVSVIMTTHGPNDPACCPTQEVTANYAYRNGALILE